MTGMPDRRIRTPSLSLTLPLIHSLQLQKNVTFGGDMKIERACMLRNLDWSIVSELPSELEANGFQREYAIVSVTYGPETTQFLSIADAVEYVKKSGAPDDFSVSLHHNDPQDRPLTVRILRVYEKILAMVEGAGPRPRIARLLDAVTTFLSLQSRPPDVQPAKDELMTQLEFYCEPLPINWSVVERIPTVLAPFGLTVEDIEVSLECFPRTVRLANLRAVVQEIELRGAPNSFVLKLQAARRCEFALSVRNSFTAHGGDCLLAELSARHPEKPLQAVIDLLGLIPQRPKGSVTSVPSIRFSSLGLLAKAFRH